MTSLLTVSSQLLAFLHLTPKTMSDDIQNRMLWYKKLDAYFDANGLYNNQLAMDYYLNTWDESMKPLRDCVHRAVEFYVSKLEPGSELPIVAANESIIDPINRVWKWSNFFSKKSLVVRQFALYGDVFIKSSASIDQISVHQQYFIPRYVVNYAEDDMSNVTDLRLDIPIGDKMHTEIWHMDGYKTYLHKYGIGQDEKYLGKPVTEGTLQSLGIDFLPFSHAKFIDTGDDWGVCCFSHALDKIDEANRMATRLHEMLFRYNKPLWVAMANAMDAQGKPLPPPKISGSTPVLEVHDDTILSMPGMSSLEALVPNIGYADGLAILQDMMHEIERDLPELAYFDLKAQGPISGKAIGMLLGDAVDKVIEARANFEAALVKSDKHALTLGLVNGIFSGLGTYDAGDFDHTIQDRPVFPMDDTDRATTLKGYTDAGLPLSLAMRKSGFTEDEIVQASQERDAEAKKAADNMANSLNFNAGPSAQSNLPA